MGRVWPLRQPTRTVGRWLSLAMALAAAELLPVRSDPAQVRLLVPLMSGDEFGRVLPLEPGAQLVQRGGETFVLVGRFRDARDAYRSGMRLQKRLLVRFVIEYPHGHPQASGAWIEQMRPGATARRLPPAVAPERAALLGGELRLADVLPEAGLPYTRGLSLAATPQPPLQALPPPQVAVVPVPIRAVPPVPVAVNPDLNYLFARVASPDQLGALRRQMPVSDVVEQNGELLAQVGIFTRSRTGRRLLQQRQQLLASSGYEWSVVASPIPDRSSER